MAEIKMRRFVVMGGSKYYACGGFEDYLDSFNTKDEAMSYMKSWLDERGEYYWAHVADTETGEMEVRGQAEATMARFCK